MLSVMLRKQGYHADTAAGVEEALAKLSGHAYDYILCDIRMPEMDGREFLRQAVSSGVTAPIVMMTAYGRLTLRWLYAGRGLRLYLKNRSSGMKL